MVIGIVVGIVMLKKLGPQAEGNPGMQNLQGALEHLEV